MKYKSIFGLLISLSGAFFSYGQGLTSSVSGIVRDNVSKKPVEGAVIFLSRKADTLKTASDAQGRFTFGDVIPGRYISSVHSLGFESDEQETLVITGKETKVEFNLQEKVFELETLTIESRATNTSESGSISLPIEKVMRMPANFFDPVRMLSSYAGVVTTNDQANNIVVKGNSPTGLLWRLNGMDIVNPNHLANAGTFNDKPTANGGGVNILSAQMLDRTDFHSGTMAPRYGNLTSAALDMTLRKGNSTKKEYTAQASLLGLDFAAEGPMGKNKSGSYLANYRYSTVGLLSQMGVNFGGERIDFQDFSFSLNNNVGKRASISLFGFGGISHNKFDAKDSSEWEVDKDRFSIYYDNTTYAVGTRFDLPLQKSFTFSAGATFSSNDQSRSASSVVTPKLPLQSSFYESQRHLLSTFASFAGRWSSHVSGEFGVMLNQYQDRLMTQDQTPTEYHPYIANDGGTTLIQPYAQLVLRTGRFTADLGGRYMYSTTINPAFDPRFNFVYQLTPTSNFSLTFGQVSQMLPPGIALQAANSINQSFLKKKYVELGHMVQFDNWKLNSSLYYHSYDKVPVSVNGNFSALNFVEGAITQSLTPIGTGSNQGVTVQAERSFVSGFYVLTGASVYKSVYTATDDVERPTKFAGKYSLMVTGGREWNKEVSGNHRSFGVHGRMLYLGGLRDTPIDENTSRTAGTTYYQGDTYAVSLKDYIRFDLRLSWRKDKKNYTRTVALDVQNVAGIKNQAFRYYDAFQGKIVTQYQVGFIPVLVYRIDF